MRNESEAAGVERALRRFDIEPMLDAAVAARAASNFRRLRGIGITVRKSMDLVIGTFRIERAHALLRDDRDFEPMAKHLGLQSAGAPEMRH